MTKNKDNFVVHSLSELQAMQSAGQTQSNWKRAGKKPVPNGADPEDAIMPITWSTTELPMPRRKQHTNLRIDADILDFFRGQGKGYQTKINAVLRSYVEQVLCSKAG